MAPSWHQNRTDLEILPNGMNLCDIDLSTSYENLGSHAATMQIIVNQYFVAFDSGYTILKEFKVKPTFSYIKSEVYRITLHKPTTLAAKMGRKPLRSCIWNFMAYSHAISRIVN